MPSGFEYKPTVMSLAEDLAAGRTTSCELVERALARIADPAGEGARTFVKVYTDSARAAAAAQDRLRAAGYVASPLAGLPVSIKDLFDVAGERTLAGSKALDDVSPAERDAPIVAGLRAAGAVLIERTNMTEFAFSGVGSNPHYGTPGNPADRRCIPGGSSSGAAVSVAMVLPSWRSAPTLAGQFASYRPRGQPGQPAEGAVPAARPVSADLGRGRRRDHHAAGAAGRTRAARHRATTGLSGWSLDRGLAPLRPSERTRPAEISLHPGARLVCHKCGSQDDMVVIGTERCTSIAATHEPAVFRAPFIMRPNSAKTKPGTQC